MHDTPDVEKQLAFEERMTQLASGIMKSRENVLANAGHHMPKAVYDIVSGDGSNEEVVQAIKEHYGGQIPSFLPNTSARQQPQPQPPPPPPEPTAQSPFEAALQTHIQVAVDAQIHARVAAVRQTITDEIQGMTEGMSDRQIKSEERLDKFERRFDNLEARPDKIEGRVDSMEGLLDDAEGRLDKMEGRIDKLEDTGREMLDKMAKYEEGDCPGISALRETFDKQAKDVNLLKRILAKLSNLLIMPVKQAVSSTKGAEQPATRDAHAAVPQKRKRDPEGEANAEPRRSTRSGTKKGVWKADGTREAPEEAIERQALLEALEFDSEDDAREAIKKSSGQRNTRT